MCQESKYHSSSSCIFFNKKKTYLNVPREYSVFIRFHGIVARGTVHFRDGCQCNGIYFKIQLRCFVSLFIAFSSAPDLHVYWGVTAVLFNIIVPVQCIIHARLNISHIAERIIDKINIPYWGDGETLASLNHFSHAGRFSISMQIDYTLCCLDRDTINKVYPKASQTASGRCEELCIRTFNVPFNLQSTHPTLCTVWRRVTTQDIIYFSPHLTCPTYEASWSAWTSCAEVPGDSLYDSLT